jgi:hypothetical protein
MKITLEQIELLKNKVDINYRDAKAALETAAGNIDEAIHVIKEKGTTHGKHEQGKLHSVEKSHVLENTTVEKKHFGTYHVSNDWVEVEKFKTRNHSFYVKRGTDLETTPRPTVVSVEYGKNKYSERRVMDFIHAILHQLRTRNNDITELQGSGTNTDQGYLLAYFTMEHADGSHVEQYYIIKSWRHVLVHLTDHGDIGNDARKVTAQIVNSFKWA